MPGTGLNIAIFPKDLLFRPRINTHEQPFKAKYWALGKELDGPWQLGHKNKEDNLSLQMKLPNLSSRVDKDIKIVASGSSNFPSDIDYDPKDVVSTE